MTRFPKELKRKDVARPSPAAQDQNGRGTIGAGRPFSAPSCNLAGRPRAEEDQPKAQHQFGGTGRAGDGNNSAGLNQHPLVHDQLFVPLRGQRKTRPYQRNNADHDQKGSEQGVESEFHAQRPSQKTVARV